MTLVLKFYLEVDWFDKFAETVMWKNLVGRSSYQKQSSWTALRAKEIWLADRYRALKPDWLNSPRLKTSLGETPMSENLFWAIFRVVEIWLADRSGALKPDWLILMETWNLIGWIPRGLKPHWVTSPCLKTPSERFCALSKSDWLGQTENIAFDPI